MDIDALKTISVLYVEDEEDIQQQLSLFLKAKTGALYTAFNGREGLDIYRKYTPDVIITDIMMPTMDGLELAKAIKEIDQDVPVIVTTAFNEQNFLLKSIEIGIDRYILKPTNPHVLLEALLKSVKVLIQKREIELNNKYIRFILDANPNFMITTNKYELEYINKTFLNFLQYSSLEDFKNDNKKLEDFFSKIDGIQEKQGWLQYIISNADNDFIVHFNDLQNSGGSPKIYLVTCNRFPELDKYIFSFTDITRIEKDGRDRVEAYTKRVFEY